MPDPERRWIEVALPAGPTTVSALWTPPVNGTVVIVSHGAGAGMEHPFLTGFAEALAAEGFGTLRFNFPYVEQGRRMPGPAAHATATWRAVVDAVRESAPGARIIATGKSYGGRMASMAVADGLAVDALAYLGYPLHPPGPPEKLRAEHLPGIAVPQLFVEGSNDPFIQPREQFDEVVAGCRDARVVWIEGGGHSYEVKGRKVAASEVGASLAPIVAEFAAAR